jgi:hypothetical protein
MPQLHPECLQQSIQTSSGGNNDEDEDDNIDDDDDKAMPATALPQFRRTVNGSNSTVTNHDYSSLSSSSIPTQAASHFTAAPTITSTTTVNEQQQEYLKWRADQGSIITFDNQKRSVQKYVRETLWSKVKFITADEELCYDGKKIFYSILVLH